MDRPRILIVCSDRELMSSLRDAFGREGEFEVCGDSLQGIDAIREAMEISPDLVILELGSSPEAGLEAAKALKKSNPELPIFLITNSGSLEEEKRAFAHGIDVVFEKDFEFQSILMNARAACAYTSSDLNSQST